MMDAVEEFEIVKVGDEGFWLIDMAALRQTRRAVLPSNDGTLEVFAVTFGESLPEKILGWRNVGTASVKAISKEALAASFGATLGVALTTQLQNLVASGEIPCRLCSSRDFDL